MDVATESLAPVATRSAEDLILAQQAAHVPEVVTHRLMQADRMADIPLRALVEIGPVYPIFSAQHAPQVRDIISVTPG